MTVRSRGRWLNLASAALMCAGSSLLIPTGSSADTPRDAAAIRDSANIATADELGARAMGAFTPCQLTHPDEIQSFAAECLQIEVLESVGAERRIQLSLVRLPSVSRREHSDPILLLAGGPGGDAQSMYTQVASVFARTGRTRDILLLDQRGTGRSTPLRCAIDDIENLDELPTDLELDLFLEQSAQCRDALSIEHNLNAYTTSHAVRDLEAVRALLGYERFNIYAVSYGTRVAQHFAKRYPDRVRSMVLDGVVAPATVLGPDLALHAQAALDGIFERCRLDEACNTAFPNIAVRARALQAALERKPKTLSISHPLTGEPLEFEFGAAQLKLVLRLASYQSQQAALLPLALAQAIDGQYQSLASLYVLTAESMSRALATGMHNTVMCSEDLSRLDLASVNDSAIQATYLGREMLDFLQNLCGIWPRGAVDPDFHEPLQSAIPTLLLSGTLDPVTPPADAAGVASTLSEARHLILPGEGHGQLGIRCMDQVLANFFESADSRTVDTSCLENKRLPPFWLSLAGPAP
jgi:pimeloyl-ACP methyl ester carboxylesterase